MKKLSLYFLLSLLYHSGLLAQTAFEPNILVLTPNRFTYEQTLAKEVSKKNDEAKKMASEQLRAYSAPAGQTNSLAANLTLMQKGDIAFLSGFDFPKQIVFFAQQYLVYRFYEKFSNCLVQLLDEKSDSTKNGLKKIADLHNIPYILNFSNVALYKQNGATYCRLKMQLYERGSDQLLVDKEYTGDWNNPGFEFACESGSIGCTISNALSHALPDVLHQIASNNPTLKKERALAEKRAFFITNRIYPHQFKDSLIRTVIPNNNNKGIELKEIYQCLNNRDNSKFVAFFIKTITEKDAKSLLSQKNDLNLTVITSKDMHDPGYLEQTPKTYAYIVRGVLYREKWYFDKHEVTYFDATDLKEGKLEYLNNLQQWDFFADSSDIPSDNFWEGKLFAKVKDKRLDPNWEKYKDMWKTEEQENSDYIGLYALVADELKKEKILDDSTFRKKMIDDRLLPFYEKQSQQKLNQIIKVEGPETYNVIYSSNKNVILNPIKITDEKGVSKIRYFVFLLQTNDVFEWNLVTPYILKKNEYTDDPIIKAINTFTQWTYTNKTLDDSNFWDECVLAKDVHGFKHLKKIQ